MKEPIGKELFEVEKDGIGTYKAISRIAGRWTGATRDDEHPSGTPRYSSMTEAQEAADQLAEVAATQVVRHSSTCSQCGDAVPCTVSPMGLLCDDCQYDMQTKRQVHHKAGR